MYKPKTCNVCGVQFQPQSGVSKRCAECLKGTCLRCGKAFRGHSTRGIEARFCSSACYLADRWDGHRRTRICLTCGKVIECLQSDRRQFCNPSCKMRHLWTRPGHREHFTEVMKDHPSVRSAARRLQLDQARRNRRFSAETRERNRAGRMRQHFPTQMTKIESALHDEFTRRGWSFEMHRTMFHRWQPDFMFELARVIVQADGDYWHTRPESAAKDAAFNWAANAGGWTVLRFWERDIKRDVSACADIVALHLSPSLRGTATLPA